MRVTKYVLWTSAMIAAVLVGWLGRDESAQYTQQQRGVEAQSAPAIDDSLEPAAERPATPALDEGVPPPSAATASWASMLRDSDDYLAFAEKAHSAATRGDAAAQWYLGLALNQCSFVFDPIFLKEPRESGMDYRTIDEARQFMSMNMAQPLITQDEELLLLMKRCRRLSEASPEAFGYGTDWTKNAADAGFPLAQAMSAQRKAEMAQYISDNTSQAAALAEARALAIDALRSRDPEVVREIADVAAVLKVGNEAEAEKRRLPWLLAACLRSPHCDSLSERMEARCKLDPQCQPYETPLDILRRDAGNDFDEVERRARELNEKIDAGTIEESDI